MLIVSIDENEALTLYQSWWRFPEIVGIEKGTEEYRKYQKMWEKATGKRIPEEKDVGSPTARKGKERAAYCECARDDYRRFLEEKFDEKFMVNRSL